MRAHMVKTPLLCNSSQTTHERNTRFPRLVFVKAFHKQKLCQHKKSQCPTSSGKPQYINYQTKFAAPWINIPCIIICFDIQPERCYEICHYSYTAIVPLSYLFHIYTSQSTLYSYQEKGKLLTISFINHVRLSKHSRSIVEHFHLIRNKPSLARTINFGRNSTFLWLFQF